MHFLVSWGRIFSGLLLQWREEGLASAGSDPAQAGGRDEGVKV